MHHFFMESDSAVIDNMIHMTGSNYNHIKNVLRMRSGEEALISDGTGRDYVCVLDRYGDDRACFKITDLSDVATELPVDLVLYQGLPKSDKMEWIIQKSVELGVARIVPVIMSRTVVKLDAKKEQKRLDRYRLIAKQAAEQSKRSLIPEISDIVSFAEGLDDAKDSDVILLPYEDAKGMEHSREVVFSACKELKEKKKGGKIAVFIGPEGGFDKKEVAKAVQYGAKYISLGHRILRTETAGLTTLSILSFLLEEEF